MQSLQSNPHGGFSVRCIRRFQCTLHNRKRRAGDPLRALVIVEGLRESRRPTGEQCRLNINDCHDIWRSVGGDFSLFWYMDNVD